MGRGIYALAILIAVLAGLAIARTPIVVPQGDAPECVMATAGPATSNALAALGEHWSCQESSHIGATTSDALARFDFRPDAQAKPQFLRSRIGLFDHLTVTAYDIDGKQRSRVYTTSNVELISGEPLFMIELPEVTDKTQAIFLQVYGMRHNATMFHAQLFDENPARTVDHIHGMLVMALLLGLMVGPILFDIVAWSALRRDFLMWHAALSSAFAFLVLVRSGLVVEFFSPSLELWRAGLIMGLGIATFAGAMFTKSFIEEEHLSPRLRFILVATGVWAVVASAIHAMSFDVLAPLGGAFHTASLAPVLAVFFGVMVDAYRKGSRMVRFQLIGWIPLALAFTLQLVTYVTPLALPTDAMPMFYLGVLSETTFTAIGVADRFFTLRRERDDALTEAEQLERLSERDPLTGLLNRRALELRFDDLRKQGFDTMALLDLDRFKQINDRFGHQVGDAVLIACADAIDNRGSRDSVAARLGGEEFVVLSRGREARRIVEQCRKAIPTAVARDIAGLDRPVTASMGVISIPKRGLNGMDGFSELYARADTLLYEAKQAGRNRTVHERLMIFGKDLHALRPKRKASEAA